MRHIFAPDPVTASPLCMDSTAVGKPRDHSGDVEGQRMNRIRFVE